MGNNVGAGVSASTIVCVTNVNNAEVAVFAHMAGYARSAGSAGVAVSVSTVGNVGSVNIAGATVFVRIIGIHDSVRCAGPALNSMSLVYCPVVCASTFGIANSAVV